MSSVSLPPSMSSMENYGSAFSSFHAGNLGAGGAPNPNAGGLHHSQQFSSFSNKQFTSLLQMPHDDENAAADDQLPSGDDIYPGDEFRIADNFDGDGSINGVGVGAGGINESLSIPLAGVNNGLAFYQFNDNAAGNPNGGNVNAAVGDLSDPDPLKAANAFLGLQGFEGDIAMFDSHFLSSFSSSSSTSSLSSSIGSVPSLAHSLTGNGLGGFHPAGVVQRRPLLQQSNSLPSLVNADVDDGFGGHAHTRGHLGESEENLLRLQRHNLERSASGGAYPQSQPQPQGGAPAGNAGFPNYWGASSNSFSSNGSTPVDAYFSNLSLNDAAKQALHINGVSLNANAPAFSPTHGGPPNGTYQPDASNANSALSQMQTQLLLQQQQQSQQRAQLQLQSALAPLSNSSPSTSATQSQATAPAASTTSSSSPTAAIGAGAAGQPTVSLATVAGGLNPSTLLASAESPHVLSLLESLLAVSPLTNLFSMEDLEKSVQLRCVLLELDRAYKEIVHLKQENMHLQKNIEKCIKMMNLQDVDQYVNNLAARMYSNNSGPSGNTHQASDRPKHHKYGGSSGGGGGGGGGHAHAASYGGNSNAGGASGESSGDGDADGGHGHGGNHGGRRVYFGPNQGSYSGGNRGRSGYGGGRGHGHRGGGGRYHAQNRE